MDTQRRPATLLPSFISTSPSISSPFRISQPTFKYVQIPQSASLTEKELDQTTLQVSETPAVGGRSSPALRTSPFSRQPYPLITSTRYRKPPKVQTYTRPRRLRIFNLLKSWSPLILYAFISLSFLATIALYRDVVFNYLDELSHWLQTDKQFGYAALFFLIFLTTFPPIPLYSTLIIFSGYTFGSIHGAIISYFASLTGAITVFIISRTLLRQCISRWLASTVTIKRVVRAVERRPTLLFLIRLAPYPYNVMNCLMAASPTLKLRTYTICTALSLPKVIIHTSLGASIHSFKDYHAVTPSDGNGNSPTAAGGTAAEGENGANRVARMWTVTGVLLCVGIMVYLGIVARRAVDDELDESDDTGSSEERLAFLSPGGLEANLSDAEDGHSMIERY